MDAVSQLPELCRHGMCTWEWRTLINSINEKYIVLLMCQYIQYIPITLCQSVQVHLVVFTPWAWWQWKCLKLDNYSAGCHLKSHLRLFKCFANGNTGDNMVSDCISCFYMEILSHYEHYRESRHKQIKQILICFSQEIILKSIWCTETIELE